MFELFFFFDYRVPLFNLPWNRLLKYSVYNKKCVKSNEYLELQRLHWWMFILKFWNSSYTILRDKETTNDTSTVTKCKAVPDSFVQSSINKQALFLYLLF